jgi:hypothetical protein
VTSTLPYHDGSASQTQAESDRFWTETSEEVDVIFGGDTHAEYTVSDDVDGDGTDGARRGGHELLGGLARDELVVGGQGGDQVDVIGLGVVGPAGQITGDLTTAFTGTTRDDRQNESALGNAVAEGFRSAQPC